MARFNKGVSILMVVMVACSAIGGARAATYTVGDSSGWTMSGDYSTWTSDKTFAVGDTLVFNYSPGHTVDEVGQSDYTSCTTGNSITSDSSGTTSITLKTAGAHYFICGTPGHCSGGMKLAVTTGAAAAPTAGGAPASSGTPTTPAGPGSTTTTTTPGMAPPTAIRTPTNTDSSSSTILSPVVAAIFAVCVAMVQKFLYYTW